VIIEVTVGVAIVIGVADPHAVRKRITIGMTLKIFLIIPPKW
jgi:hypothetical protein